MSRPVWSLAAAALVAACAVTVYLNALHNPFVYDDRPSVVENPSLRDPGNWRYLLLHDRFRPVVNLSYAFDFARSGLDPLGYHVTSVLLHAINAILVTALAARLLRRGDAAVVAGTLFAVHPLMTEAVGYVSGRSELLAASFVLSGFLLLDRLVAAEGKAARIALGAGAFLLQLLGLACKETAAMLPAVFLVHERLFLAASPAERRRRLRSIHLPLLALVLALGLARLVAFLALEAELAPRPIGQHWLGQATVIWRYLALLVAPLSQSIVHAVPRVSGPTDGHALLAVAALVALLWVALRLRGRAAAVSFGIAWFLLFLLPSSVIPLVEPMAEHRVYLASAGFFLAAGWLFARSAGSARGLALARIGFVLALAGLSALTVRRNCVWADPLTLWQDAAAKASGVWITSYALADAYQERGDCASASVHYRRAIQILPREPSAWVNLAACRLREGRLEEAGSILSDALVVCPGSSLVRNNLAYVEMRRGNVARARELRQGTFPGVPAEP